VNKKINTREIQLRKVLWDSINFRFHSQLFVERHNNVTILFADIVNFTPLTVTLSPEDLVETLNQLFGEFDEAAKV